MPQAQARRRRGRGGEWLRELWLARSDLALFKRFADAYCECLVEKGWVDDWLRWGEHSVNLADVARKMGVPLREAVKVAERLREKGLVTYTHYFIYGEERAHSVSIPVWKLRELCSFLESKIDAIARLNPAKAEEIKQKYLPRACRIIKT